MAGAFRTLLRHRQTDPADRSWLFVPYDQLSGDLGPLAREDPAALGIVLVESPWKAARRPYHRQKLALVLANLRHFALEQAERGVAVRHVVAAGPYGPALEPLARELGRDRPLRVMEPAERELRQDLAPLIQGGLLELIPHEGWLTSTDQFQRSQKKAPPWRMDAFYRLVRRETGLLMDGNKPAGGKFSFDADNRKPWKGKPPAPEPPSFPRDPVKEEVADLIESRFQRHPGTLDLERLPATRKDAETLWRWARRECLPTFGPYEDAMSTRSPGLFHTRLAPLLNLHRILPRQVVEETAALDIPLASKEGFVRQVLGWREFVRHVHRATDGFRDFPGDGPGVARRPGDGGWGRWQGKRWLPGKAGSREPDGGAEPSFLGAHRPLPAAFWGEESGLACLDRVVAEVWDTGYGHHITRLMILSNIATLLDVSPRELTDWFWAAYADAYDWVVEPNVLGMGTFAAGDLMTTKPYISGAAYINRMSDFCGTCHYDPRKDCPLTPLYWAFLGRHRERLSDNPRLRLPLASLARRSRARRAEDARAFEALAKSLASKPVS